MRFKKLHARSTEVAQDVLRSQLSVCTLISAVFCIASMLEHIIACQYSNSNIAYILDNALNKKFEVHFVKRYRSGYFLWQAASRSFADYAV